MTLLHIIICTGGTISEWAIPEIQKGNVYIGADKGALFLVKHGFRPYLAIGDFDSVTADEMESIRANSENVKDFDAIDKDYTDTELALHEAIALNPKKITIVGALGTRFDHSLANIQLLTLAHTQHIDIEIIDAQNKLCLVSDTKEIEKGHYPFLSILPFTEKAEGIDLIGMKYPLTNATIAKGQAIGISNIIEGQTGIVKVKSGTLLVIQSMD